MAVNICNFVKVCSLLIVLLPWTLGSDSLFIEYWVETRYKDVTPPNWNKGMSILYCTDFLTLYKVMCIRQLFRLSINLHDSHTKIHQSFSANFLIYLQYWQNTSPMLQICCFKCCGTCPIQGFSIYLYCPCLFLIATLPANAHISERLCTLAFWVKSY